MTEISIQGAEADRLIEDDARRRNWKRWGPYLSARQWGTVREDYSPHGTSWEYFPHEQARSRAYRWGEDGLLGITDRECRLCFALALWNGRDPILKERLFGLANPQGNHGEDVKELYYYLDSTPTHTYLKALYKYPQGRFPYEALVEENRRRDRHQPEYELTDTGIFDQDRYFDVQVEYAKGSPNDVLVRITVANRGPDSAALFVLPTLWYRNTWAWGCTTEGCWPKPLIRQADHGVLVAEHASLERFYFMADRASNGAGFDWLFTENETNGQRLFGVPNRRPFVKDSFHDYVIAGNREAVNPRMQGTKAAAHYRLEIPAGQETTLRLRLFNDEERPPEIFGEHFREVFESRVREADEFYGQLIPGQLDDDERRVARQAYAGMLWNKQFYNYVVEDWLKGDPNEPVPPASREQGRNADWKNVFTRDVLSVPDNWEYPWFAAWDLAFHMIVFAHLDAKFAKDQLRLMLREWYMHPNGQLPAYEFDFSDVNPPVHAWACWRVYKMTAPRGQRDRQFLASAFQQLLFDFTWWLNRKDVRGRHIFSGGFLGLDNIGVFDRSKPLPEGRSLEQADGTAWMAFYCMEMLSMALELAREDPAYEDLASKFFEHFVQITDAINSLGGTGLWNEDDGFYYDQLLANGSAVPLRVRSIVGLIPLFAVEVLETGVIDELPGFKKRMDWFLRYRGDLAKYISYVECPITGRPQGRRLLAIPSRERLLRVLRYVLDEDEFLSPYGVRSLSKHHERDPYVCRAGGQDFRVAYVPGESDSDHFGGNSNWRGPIWFPLNYLLIEALERYHHFYGDTLKVQCPTGSGPWMNLRQVAWELERRLARLFLPDKNGQRPCDGDDTRYSHDPHFRGLVRFHEYFHGNTGSGLGASHQTGWTGLITRILESLARNQQSDAIEQTSAVAE